MLLWNFIPCTKLVGGSASLPLLLWSWVAVLAAKHRSHALSASPFPPVQPVLFCFSTCFIPADMGSLEFRERLFFFVGLQVCGLERRE